MGSVLIGIRVREGDGGVGGQDDERPPYSFRRRDKEHGLREGGMYTEPILRESRKLAMFTASQEGLNAPV